MNFSSLRYWCRARMREIEDQEGSRENGIISGDNLYKWRHRLLGYMTITRLSLGAAVCDASCLVLLQGESLQLSQR